MSNYNHKEVEAKWKSVWEKSQIYKTKEDFEKEKFYVLDMFPYPSGAGLHVGHPKGYIATDVMARMKMMQGFNVLHPMGWDAFGLPAENYAIANKVHPSVATAKNIETFKKQLGLLGFTYDWEREVNTTDPNYYKWTQWAFIQMFKKGLAFESNEPINWCPTCKTGLANEDLEDGKCERCGTPVERKPLRQWVLKITDYAERLLNDIDKLGQWPEPIKEMQRNWIGKSEGALVKFRVMLSEASKAKSKHLKDERDPSTPLRSAQDDVVLEVFTTRPDTLFGATYMVVAPEHELIEKFSEKIENLKEVEKYIKQAKNKSDLERTENKEKTGVELKGIKAVNPVNNEELPIFVADYVLTGYGTGAIMAVPAHDERDFEFAKKFGLPVKEVVAKKFGERRSDAIKRDGVAGVLTYKDKVLVLHDPKFDLWRLPAGGYEDGETDLDTLLRETEEETQYKNFKVKEFLGTIEANFDVRFNRGVYRHKFQKGYLMELVDEEKTTISDPDNVGFEVYWLSFEEAMKKFTLNKESWGEEEFIRRTFDIKERCFSGEGTSINSDFLNDLSTVEAKSKMIAWLEEKGIGQKKVQYKLRDWVFSRQRYWGEPIPLIHCEKCETKAKEISSVFTFHAIGSSNEEHWHPWLDEELASQGLKSITPLLPNPNEPKMEEWLEVAENLYGKSIDENSVMLGRSLGARSALKFAENHRLKKLVLLCPTMDGGDEHWKQLTEKVSNCFNVKIAQKFNAIKIDYKKVQKNVEEIIFLFSKNDPYIPFSFEEYYRKNLPNAKFVIYQNAGHFGSAAGYNTFPDLLKYIFGENNGWIPVPEKDLPLELPKVENYEPSGTGESPLANIEEWVNTKCPVCGGPAKRETNTMPQWAGSCWYYLAYVMRGISNFQFPISKYREAFDYWTPVDLYVGGAEHATRHLIYARFWHKFLFDIGVVANDEPFARLQNVGLILAEDGRKMSKRWNNVINPDDIVEQYGADAMRLYEMFMGPFDQPVAWSTKGVIGCRRFLEKVWVLQDRVMLSEASKAKSKHLDDERDPSTPLRSAQDDDKKLLTLLHQTIKKVSEDIEAMRYNTAIAQMMILVNEMIKEEKLLLTHYSLFLQLLSPFAPHIAEELWSELGNKESIFKSDWPKYDPNLIQDETITIAVQVNGKLRNTFEVPADMAEEEIKKQALASEKVQKWLEGKEPKKVIYVKGKLVSVVV